jgi:hypothetical protein
VAFLVAQGAKEMGIRMALGATPRGIGLLVVRHGLLIAAAGIVLGVAGAVVLTRLMQSLLFGIASTDSVTYLFVAGLVAATALAASYIPARRASRLDPMQSLRWGSLSGLFHNGRKGTSVKGGRSEKCPRTGSPRCITVLILNGQRGNPGVIALPAAAGKAGRRI